MESHVEFFGPDFQNVGVGVTVKLFCDVSSKSHLVLKANNWAAWKTFGWALVIGSFGLIFSTSK